ncbi:MAG TPA: transglycosylase SLT domain-containing protein [Vicinamibacterales bacterium]|nr:transglycosylase SLT domain-containing protein [Vicinamibacterales bacterium]
MMPHIRPPASSVCTLLLAASLSIASCASPPGAQQQPPPSNAAASPPSGTPAPGGVVAPQPATADAQPALTLIEDLDANTTLGLHEKWTGDFDWKGDRRFIRALVPFSKTNYFLDGTRQAGIAYDALQEFEKTLRERAPKGVVAPKIVIIPTSPDQVLPALEGSLGDIAVGGFSIVDRYRTRVDFSTPTKDDIKDVVVTGPASTAKLSTLEDLSGQEVTVRRVSSYHEDLVDLNARLKRSGKPPVTIVDADDRLQDEDLLQMVDAGIVPITVVKDIYTDFWKQIYDQMTVRSDLVVKDGVQLAWGVRKNTPVLHGLVDDFVRTHRAGTMFGNVLLKKYLGNPARLKNPKSAEELARFRTLATPLRKYADQYDFDWLLVTAQAYQESQLDQSRRSGAGAVGIMQIKPETARDKNVGVPNVTDKADDNIHAGVKYMRFMIDRYFADSKMDKLNRGLFALASYNAGPARVAQLRKKAQAAGLNPDEWFYNVEIVASRDIGRETVDYVSNIYKYYTAYKAIQQQNARAAAKSKRGTTQP